MAQTNYSPLTFDHTQVPSTKTNFPLKIKVADTRFRAVANGGKVGTSGGTDIRPCSDASGTPITGYQLVRYTESTGEVIMTVNIASLSSSSDTTIYLFYGDTSLTSDGSSRTVWPAAYAAVYYLGDGTTLSVADSANDGSGPYDLTNVGLTATSGKVGGAAADDDAHYAHHADAAIYNGSAYTWQCWVNMTTVATNHTVFMKGIYNTSWSYACQSWNTGSDLIMFISDSPTDGGSNSVSTTSSFVSVSTPFLLTVVYDGSQSTNTTKVKIYANATLQTLTSTGTIPTSLTDSTNDFYLGLFNGVSRYLAGSLEDFRMLTTALDADSITIRYNSENNPSGFTTLGSESTVGSGYAGSIPMTLTLASPTSGNSSGGGGGIGGVRFGGSVLKLR